MDSMNPKVDEYLRKAKKWQEEFEKLRMIILPSGLTEELKWGKPCYTFQDSNILIIQGFKEFCALMFCKGALLKDPKGILIQQTKHAAKPHVTTGIANKDSLDRPPSCHDSSAMNTSRTVTKSPKPV